MEEAVTLREALLLSKDTGENFTRDSSEGFVGWVSWVDHFIYELEGEDIVAEDWQPSSQVIERLTKGRWTTADKKEKT